MIKRWIVLAWILWISEPGQDWEIVADYVDVKAQTEESRCWKMLKPLAQDAQERGSKLKYRCLPDTTDPRGPGQTARDKKRDAWMRDQGYSVLRLSEKDINSGKAKAILLKSLRMTTTR